MAALQLLAVMVETERSMRSLASILEVVPQTLLAVPVREKRELGALPNVMRAIRAVEQNLGKNGRVLVRYSGTEAKVRILIEGPDDAKNQVYANVIAAELKAAVG